MLDINKIYTSNNYGQFKVVSYRSWNDITIEFIDTKSRIKTYSHDITKGNVKDRMRPSVYGVGYLGCGEYNTKTNPYSFWLSMIRRCYSPTQQKTNPTYKDCTVCDEWLNFQNFAIWFDDNYINGLHLDKDIKIKGNKIYSPDACAFVTRNDNNIKAQAKDYMVIDPLGVIHNVYNMAEFCRANNLSNSKMCLVSSGKRRHHKGWVKA